jgi:AcrR family transcriptional regulator
MAKSRRALLRPGGRNENVRKAVAKTVLDLVGAGSKGLNIQEIARRSGVHRTTIHRRWGNRVELLREALAERRSLLQIEYTGNFADDMREIAYAFRDFCKNPYEMALCSLIAATNDREFAREVYESWLPVEHEMHVPIRAAQQKGEVRADLDPNVIIDMITSPIMAWVAFAKAVPDDVYLDKLVAYAIGMCTAR